MTAQKKLVRSDRKNSINGNIKREREREREREKGKQWLENALKEEAVGGACAEVCAASKRTQCANQ